MKKTYADKAMSNIKWWRKMRGGVWEQWLIQLPCGERRVRWFAVADDLRFRSPNMKPEPQRSSLTCILCYEVEDWRKLHRKKK